MGAGGNEVERLKSVVIVFLHEFQLAYHLHRKLRPYGLKIALVDTIEMRFLTPLAHERVDFELETQEIGMDTLHLGLV